MLTGDVSQDALLRRKLEHLAVEPEAALLDDTAADISPRDRRLRIENQVLATNPQQRRTTVLDYIRRGRLSAGREILPEIIQRAPELLDSGLIDFAAADYSEQAVLERLLATFDHIRVEITRADDSIRRVLAQHGVEVTARRYLNERWYRELEKQLMVYKTTVSQPNQKHPLVVAGDLVGYQRDIKMRTASKLQAELNGDVAQCLDEYVTEPGSFTVDFPAVDTSDPIQAFIWQREQEFLRYPTLSEYKGEIVQSPPNFTQMRVKKGIRLVERDAVPEDPTGVIFDGNFGYNAAGVLVKPKETIIIDHHDALNSKQYDTATVMTGRFWQERLGKKFTQRDWINELKKMREAGFIGGEGKLVTMLNDPDTDALLAIWVFRNPGKAQHYAEVLNNISFCGDFLVGSRVMEYGATARDYNYIIMNYLDACVEEVKHERVVELEMRRAKHIQEQTGKKVRHAELSRNREALKESDSEIAVLVTEYNAFKLQQVEPVARKQWSQELNKKRLALETALDEREGAVAVRERANIAAEISRLDNAIAEIGKEIKAQATAKLTVEENGKIVTHFLDIMEDIIQQPFKYQKYLLQGRAKEERALRQLEQWYAAGDIEVVQAEGDPEIIQIMPLKGGDIPTSESIDGMYFFLRRRVDFNRKIVATIEKSAYMVAINTQDRAELKHYDFNELVPALRLREQELLNEAMKQKGAQLATASGKERIQLEKDISRLQELAKRNQEGRLWRNRNQMAFVFRSLIPQAEFMDRLYAWKKLEDEKIAVDGLPKAEVAKRVEAITVRISNEADRIMSLGQWAATGEAEQDHATALHALVDRVPTKPSGLYAGFDAGIACALDLIPRDKQELAAGLHANYTPEAVAKIVRETTDIQQIDPESATCWWLVACSICTEGEIDQRGFLKQLAAFEQLRNNPQARREAAIIEYTKMVRRFRMEKFVHPDTGAEIEVPFGEEDGCIQGAYLKGHRFGVSHLSRLNGDWYELGSHQPSLGLEQFAWSGTFQRNGKDYPSGPQYGAKNFFRIGYKDQLIRALFEMQQS